MTNRRFLCSLFAAGAAVGWAASLVFQPQPAGAAPGDGRGVVQDLAAFEAQVMDLQDQVRTLQNRLAGLERTGDGEFVFHDPVVVKPESNVAALSVLGSVEIESRDDLPATRPTLSVLGRSQFDNGSADAPTILVAGTLLGESIGAELVESEIVMSETSRCTQLNCFKLDCDDAVSGGVINGDLILGETAEFGNVASIVSTSDAVVCDVLRCWKLGRFENVLFVAKTGTLDVRGLLDAKGEVHLPPHDHD